MKVLPIDKNTKRGFCDVNTPQSEEWQLSYSLLEEYNSLKKEMTKNKQFVEKYSQFDDKEVKKIIKIIKGEQEGKQRRLLALKNKMVKSSNLDKIIVQKLKKIVPRDAFIAITKSATQEYNDFLNNIPTVSEDDI